MFEYGGNEFYGSPEETGITRGVRNIIIANVVIYFLSLIVSVTFGKHGWSLANIFMFFGFVPKFALTKFYVWQFVTYAFLHSASPLHILFNMYVLWIAGPGVERRLGTMRFYWFYLSAAVFAALFFQLPLSYTISNSVAIPVVGASGAVLATLVLYAGLYPDTRMYIIIFGPFKIRIVVMVIVFIDLATLLTPDATGIAAACHLGGVTFGYAYFRLSNRVEQVFESWRQKLEDEERRANRDLRIQLDNLLRKINEEGQDSLTAKERAFLEKASQHFREKNK